MRNIYVVFLLIFSFSFAQKKVKVYDYIRDYYQFVYQAQYEYLSGNYQNAYDLLKTAEKNCPLLNQTSIYEPKILVECALQLKKEKEAMHYAELMMKEHGYKSSFFENDSIFERLTTSKKWKKLKEKASKYYDEYLKNIDFDLRKELNAMKKADQSVRTNGFNAEKAKIVDNENNEKLKRIVAECGCFPSYSVKKIGDNNLDENDVNVDVLVFHINREDAEYWKPVFLDLIRSGNAPANIYGNLIDSNLRINGVFDYGIYYGINEDQINDFENLDKRRIAVGLAPWELNKKIQELIKKKYNF